MEDGFRGGLQVEDGLAVARMLEADGTLDAIQLIGRVHGPDADGTAAR